MAAVSASIIAQRLIRHRKGDLIELAREAGYSYDETVLSKTLQKNIAAQLAQHLYQNSDTLSENELFSKYFLLPMSPAKRVQSQVASPSPAKRVQPQVASPSPGGRSSRRLADQQSNRLPFLMESSVKDETEENNENAENDDRSTESSDNEDDNRSRTGSMLSSPTPYTPAQSSHKLKAQAVYDAVITSPKVVSQVIERQSSNIRARVHDVWAQFGIEDSRDHVRDVLSSTIAIDSLLLFTEFIGLLRRTIPVDYPFPTPAITTVGLAARQYTVPNIFVLFTTQFWASASTWGMSSLIVPLFLAYFCNLTSQAKQSSVREFDPLVFNITKAILTWTIYSQGVRFGVLNNSTVGIVNSAFPGEWQYVVLGSLVGVVSSMYEAILRK